MEESFLPAFYYHLDESDPDIVILRRQDGAFVAAFSARGATREGIVEARPPQRSRAMERYLHSYEQARREIEGREPLPDLPYTEEDLEDDRRTLEETIPAYRASTGYQSGEGKRFLDHWEQSIRDKLAKGAQRDG